jgi:hypothetical protein
MNLIRQSVSPSFTSCDLPLGRIRCRILGLACWMVMMVLGIMALVATKTTTAAAYSLILPSSSHKYYTTCSAGGSQRLAFWQQKHESPHSRLGGKPLAYTLQKSALSSKRSFWTCLAAVSDTSSSGGTGQEDLFNSTQSSEDRNTTTASSSSTLSSVGSNSSSSSSTTTHFRKTLQDMAAAIRGRLQLQNWGAVAPPGSISITDTAKEEEEDDDDGTTPHGDDLDQQELLKSLLQNIEGLQDELDQLQLQQQSGVVTVGSNDDVQLATQLQQAVADVSQNNSLTSQLQLGAIQQHQSSPTVYQLLEQASLKLQQHTQQRQTLHLEMVALKEQYETQIVTLQGQLRLNSSEREVVQYQHYEQEIQSLLEEQQQERIATLHRVDEILAQGRHDLLALESQ